MEQTTTKPGLLNLVKDERSRWDDLLEQVGESRMQIAGVVGEWSVKDIISHLTAWENRLVAWLEAIRAGREPTAPPWDADLDETATNAWIYDHNRERRLTDVLDESRRVHLHLMELLDGVEEKDLLSESRYTWLGGNSLTESISGNTHEHYREHGDQIQSWLVRQESE